MCARAPVYVCVCLEKKCELGRTHFLCLNSCSQCCAELHNQEEISHYG